MSDAPERPSTVWVFVGERNGVGGVFSRVDIAKRWIATHGLSGILTEYPLDIGAYDWAISSSAFKPSKPEHSYPGFIGSFASSKMNHMHFDEGKEVG
jgi:hypothetical protein